MYFEEESRMNKQFVLKDNDVYLLKKKKLYVLIVCFSYFRRYLNIAVQFVPELLFLLCIFGYLIALVFLKWTTYTAKCDACAPALLIRK